MSVEPSNGASPGAPDPTTPAQPAPVIATADDDHDEQRRRLHRWVERARVQRARAHAPYSDFPVGAVVVTADGNTYDGVNVENASYPLTMCAERVAIGAMVAAGDRSGIVAVAVAGRGDEPLTPCGACRQVIAEFAQPDTPVVSLGGDGGLVEWTIGELLPAAFGSVRLTAGQGVRETDDGDPVTDAVGEAS